MDQQFRVAESQCGFCKGNGAAHIYWRFWITREAQRREGWDKRRGICVTSLVFSISINDLLRKVLRKKGRPELVRKNCSLSF